MRSHERQNMEKPKILYKEQILPYSLLRLPGVAIP